MVNKILVGISAPNSSIAKHFVKIKRNHYIFRKYNKDINDYNSFQNWIKKNNTINCFINFAAITSAYKAEKMKKKTLKTNYQSVLKIIKIIDESNLPNFKYFLAISSSHVFKKSNSKLRESSIKKPENIYGKSKLLMENNIKINSYKLYFNVGIARIFNFYDKNSLKSFFIDDVKQRIKKQNEPILFKNVKSIRDFIHIDDIVEALSHMINKKLHLDFNVCSGKKLSLVKIIRKLNIKKKKIIFKGSYKLGLIGSNRKLISTGWKPKKKITYNYFI